MLAGPGFQCQALCVPKAGMKGCSLPIHTPKLPVHLWPGILSVYGSPDPWDHHTATRLHKQKYRVRLQRHYGINRHHAIMATAGLVCN